MAEGAAGGAAAGPTMDGEFVVEDVEGIIKTVSVKGAKAGGTAEWVVQSTVLKDMPLLGEQADHNRQEHGSRS